MHSVLEGEENRHCELSVLESDSLGEGKNAPTFLGAAELSKDVRSSADRFGASCDCSLLHSSEQFGCGKFADGEGNPEIAAWKVHDNDPSRAFVASERIIVWRRLGQKRSDAREACKQIKIQSWVQEKIRCVGPGTAHEENIWEQLVVCPGPEKVV